MVRGGHGIRFVFATGRGVLSADLRTIRRFADTMPEWHTEVIAICRMRRHGAIRRRLMPCQSHEARRACAPWWRAAALALAALLAGCGGGGSLFGSGSPAVGAPAAAPASGAAPLRPG